MPNWITDYISNNSANIKKTIKNSNKNKEKENLTSSYQGANLILSQDYYDHSKPIKLSGLKYGYNSKGKLIVKGKSPKITPELTSKIQKQFGEYAYIDGNYIKNKKSNRVIGLVNEKGEAAFIHSVRKRSLSEAHEASFDSQSHEAHVMRQKEIDKKISKTDNVGKALGTLALTPITIVSPSNIVAGISEASKGNYGKAFSKWTGTNELADIKSKGIFEASEGMSKWYDEHPVTGSLINVGGDMASIIGIGKTIKSVKEIPGIINTLKASPAAAKEAILTKGLARAQVTKETSEAAKTIYNSLSKRAQKALKTLDGLAEKPSLTAKQQQTAEKANEIIREEIKRMSANQKRLLAKEYIKGGKEELANKTTAFVMDVLQNPKQYAKAGAKKTGKFIYNVGKDMAFYNYVASPAAEWTLDQFNINPKDKTILKEAIAWPTTSLVSRGADRLAIMGLSKANNALDIFGSRLGANEEAAKILGQEQLAKEFNKLGTKVGKIQDKVYNFQNSYSKATHPLLYTKHAKKDIIGNLSTTPKEALLGMGFGTLEETNPKLSKYAWIFPGIAHNITRRIENGLKYNLHLNSGGAQTAEILKENIMNPTTAYNGMLSVVGKARRSEGKRAADSAILPSFGGMADVAYKGKEIMPGLTHYTTLAVGNRYSNPYLKKVNEARYIADKLYQPYKGSVWETFRRSKGDAVDIFNPYGLKEFNYLLDNSIVLPSQYVASYQTKLPSPGALKGNYTRNEKKITEKLNNGTITKEQAAEELNTLKNGIIQQFEQYNFGQEYASKIKEIFQKDLPFKTQLSEAASVLKEEVATLKNKLIQENRFFGQNNKDFAKTMEEYKQAVKDGDKRKVNQKLKKFLKSISSGNKPMSLRQYLLSDEYTNIGNHTTRQGDIIIGKNLNHVGGKNLGSLVYNWKGNRWAPSTFLIKDKNGIYREFGLGSDFGGTGSGGNSEPGNTISEKIRKILIKNSKYHMDVGSKSLPVVFSPIDIMRTASGRTTTNMVPAFYFGKEPIFNFPIQQKQDFFKNFIFNY